MIPHVGITRTGVVLWTYQHQQQATVQMSPSFREWRIQMNNSNTPKIVIGVGLVALYAIGFTVFALRGKHDTVVAQGTPSEISAPMAADSAAPLALPESASASAEASA